MSVMVGVGRGAQAGVLIRKAEAIEAMEKVRTLVVDKTGTLTEGRPKVLTVKSAGRFSEDELLTMAASLEQQSEHPLAAAIRNSSQERGLKLTDSREFESITGGGVTGQVGNYRVLVGKPDLLRASGVTGIEEMEPEARLLQTEGQTVVFVAIDNHVSGMIGIADPIKTSTPSAIDHLHGLGMKIIMLTGDNEATARAIGNQVGIDDVEAGIEPQHKHQRVQQLRRSGQIVAMAGDGINDGPALAAADVGIAMGTGTDVAIESAGITLVKGDLRGIEKAVRLSRAMMRNIRQNLFFAFIYNSLGVPIAAGILYPFFGILLSPIIAGAAMSLSSVSVIANALRLRQIKL